MGVGLPGSPDLASKDTWERLTVFAGSGRQMAGGYGCRVDEHDV